MSSTMGEEYTGVPGSQMLVAQLLTKGREDGQFFQRYLRGFLLELRNYLVSRMIFTDDSGFSISYQSMFPNCQNCI